MPRRPRQEAPGAIYHVTARGTGGAPIVLDDADRANLLGALARAVADQEWQCVAYCLMDNHLHLVVVTPHANLGAGMRRLLGGHAQSFNRRHGRTGHVFGDRYHAERVTTETHLLEACAYVVLNPVRAGICARPDDWWWSSYRETAGLTPASTLLNVDLLLAVVGDTAPDRLEAYRRYVAAVQGRPRGAAGSESA